MNPSAMCWLLYLYSSFEHMLSCRNNCATNHLVPACGILDQRTAARDRVLGKPSACLTVWRRRGRTSSQRPPARFAARADRLSGARLGFFVLRPAEPFQIRAAV